MLESLPVMLLVGTGLGFLTGLGIGGGSLLILWLTMVLNVDPLTARSINLLFFIPSAVIACIFRLKQGKLSLRPILPAIIAGCIAATSAVSSSWATAVICSNASASILRRSAIAERFSPSLGFSCFSSGITWWRSRLRKKASVRLELSSTYDR